MKNMTESRETIKCSCCKKVFPATTTYFYKNRSKKTGLNNICKQCSSIYNKNYRLKNLGYFEEYQKQYTEDSKGSYIYFIMENNRIMYIGSTNKDLKFRIKYQHLKGYTHLKNYFEKNTWTSVKYIELDFVEDIPELRYVESLFISELQPELNRKEININIDPDREEEITEEAYNIMDHLEEYLKTYITNEC